MRPIRALVTRTTRHEMGLRDREDLAQEYAGRCFQFAGFYLPALSGSSSSGQSIASGFAHRRHCPERIQATRADGKLPVSLHVCSITSPTGEIEDLFDVHEPLCEVRLPSLRAANGATTPAPAATKEIQTVVIPGGSYDVVILGSGIAGLA